MNKYEKRYFIFNSSVVAGIGFFVFIILRAIPKQNTINRIWLFLLACSLITIYIIVSKAVWNNIEMQESKDKIINGIK